MDESQAQIIVSREIVPVHSGTTALIVDDDRHVRSYLRMLLRMVGVTTAWEAVDPAQALELFSAHRPTVVLLDVDLPDVSGADVMRRLLALDAQASVIAVTSRGDLLSVTPCNELGAIGWVPIRVVREEIVQRLSAVLDRIETREATLRRLVA